MLHACERARSTVGQVTAGVLGADKTWQTPERLSSPHRPINRTKLALVAQKKRKLTPRRTQRAKAAC